MIKVYKSSLLDIDATVKDIIDGVPEGITDTIDSNPNTEEGFKNPYVSNEDSSVVAINYSSSTEKDYKFYIGVGNYVYNPYNSTIVSKEKPLKVYNGISLEEPDDTYRL